MDNKQIEEMAGLLRYYSELPADFNDIDRLIVAKRKLIHYSFYWATEVGKALEVYNTSYADRKNFVAKYIVNEIKNGESVSKSEFRAEAEAANMRLTEAKAEALYREYKGYQTALENAIQSVMQDISKLKKEAELSKQDA